MKKLTNEKSESEPKPLYYGQSIGIGYRNINEGIYMDMMVKRESRDLPYVKTRERKTQPEKEFYACNHDS